MATVAQVITDKLAGFSIEVSSAALAMLLVDNDLIEGDEYSKDNAPKVKSAMLGKLSELLAMPDVTEGGFSLKWDRSAVQAYCNQLRTDLGLVSSSQPVVSDATNRW
jgi:hypothetical protein